MSLVLDTPLLSETATVCRVSDLEPGWGLLRFLTGVPWRCSAPSQGRCLLWITDAPVVGRRWSHVGSWGIGSSRVCVSLLLRARCTSMCFALTQANA